MPTEIPVTVPNTNMATLIQQPVHQLPNGTPSAEVHVVQPVQAFIPQNIQQTVTATTLPPTGPVPGSVHVTTLKELPQNIREKINAQIQEQRREKKRLKKTESEFPLDIAVAPPAPIQTLPPKAFIAVSNDGNENKTTRILVPVSAAGHILSQNATTVLDSSDQNQTSDATEEQSEATPKEKTPVKSKKKDGKEGVKKNRPPTVMELSRMAKAGLLKKEIVEGFGKRKKTFKPSIPTAPSATPTIFAQSPQSMSQQTVIQLPSYCRSNNPQVLTMDQLVKMLSPEQRKKLFPNKPLDQTNSNQEMTQVLVPIRQVINNSGSSLPKQTQKRKTVADALKNKSKDIFQEPVDKQQLNSLLQKSIAQRAQKMYTFHNTFVGDSPSKSKTLKEGKSVFLYELCF